MIRVARLQVLAGGEASRSIAVLPLPATPSRRKLDVMRAHQDPNDHPFNTYSPDDMRSDRDAHTQAEYDRLWQQLEERREEREREK